jgi:hypothetical protein
MLFNPLIGGKEEFQMTKCKITNDMRSNKKSGTKLYQRFWLSDFGRLKQFFKHDSFFKVILCGFGYRTMLKTIAFFCTHNEIENEVAKTMKSFGNHNEGDHGSLQ